jgi:hypothetical protein
MGSSSPAGHQIWHDIRTNGVDDTAKVYNMGDKAHKPPTGVEITAIRAAQDLFLSSSFKLQVSRIVLHCESYLLLLPNSRSMLFYQMFGQKIHANNHWIDSSFLFTRVCRLFPPLNPGILWQLLRLFRKAPSYLMGLGMRIVVNEIYSHPNKLSQFLTPYQVQPRMPIGKLRLRSRRISQSSGVGLTTLLSNV